MKRFIALMMVGVVSCSCLKAAQEPTASYAGGIEKVMLDMTNRQVVNVAPHWASFVTQKKAQPIAVHLKPGVLSEVRTSAATKIAAHRAPGVFNSLKPAWLASSDPVHWKVVHRTPTAKVGFVGISYSQPGPLGPDNPALSTATEKMPFAWRAPADDNPAIEGREGGRQEGSLA